jgi:hypothetical protein
MCFRPSDVRKPLLGGLISASLPPSDMAAARGFRGEKDLH